MSFKAAPCTRRPGVRRVCGTDALVRTVVLLTPGPGRPERRRIQWNRRSELWLLQYINTSKSATSR